ncbi:MAG: hypothetical protein IPJ65_24015 [Archangiaceae bacterium]|nr:hypothetical protein [Archangiaceae bacterium]
MARALRRRKSRGQATVELAIACILIVPIFLYVLFLEDLLRHKLTLQEVVVSTPWDFNGIDYQRYAGDVDGEVAKYSRMMWCDHSSAYNSYDPGFECGDDDPDRHHKEVSAHVCWQVGGDGQGENEIHCSRAADTATGYFGLIPGIDEFKSDVNKGGAISCTAYAGVLNYYLPQKILQSFSQVDTTRAEYLRGTQVHSHNGISGQNIYRLTRQHFTVLHDPWAQTSVDEMDGPGSGALHDRTQYVYGHWLGLALGFAPAMIFVGKGIQEELIGPQALPVIDLPTSDNLMDANVAFRKAAGGKVDNHYASPWMDWQNNPVQTSYNNRGKYYMGATSEPN